jgi:hypothetical protein
MAIIVSIIAYLLNRSCVSAFNQRPASMIPFTVSRSGKIETFLPAEDFSEGHDRVHWTLSGIEKLIKLGLWCREYDLRGNLKSKPPLVETIIATTTPTKRKKPMIPPLSRTLR